MAVAHSEVASGEGSAPVLAGMEEEEVEAPSWLWISRDGMPAVQSRRGSPEFTDIERMVEFECSSLETKKKRAGSGDGSSSASVVTEKMHERITRIIGSRLLWVAVARMTTTGVAWVTG